MAHPPSKDVPCQVKDKVKSLIHQPRGYITLGLLLVTLILHAVATTQTLFVVDYTLPTDLGTNAAAAAIKAGIPGTLLQRTPAELGGLLQAGEITPAIATAIGDVQKATASAGGNVRGVLTLHEQCRTVTLLPPFSANPATKSGVATCFDVPAESTTSGWECRNKRHSFMTGKVFVYLTLAVCVVCILVAIGTAFGKIPVGTLTACLPLMVLLYLSTLTILLVVRYTKFCGDPFSGKELTPDQPTGAPEGSTTLGAGPILFFIATAFAVLTLISSIVIPERKCQKGQCDKDDVATNEPMSEVPPQKHIVVTEEDTKEYAANEV